MMPLLPSSLRSFAPAFFVQDQKFAKVIIILILCWCRWLVPDRFFSIDHAQNDCNMNANDYDDALKIEILFSWVGYRAFKAKMQPGVQS
ncbi:hypothetical protein TH47_07115 [Thalassospira sp. MCCC 1A02803]|nr:hypothetical protein AUQ41_04615 [Thalassospira sp. MCCC 1A02898]ONH88303.1 hypothetical protein TH47_07115 [Thalassospira sp. MCCC 1A02803]